MLVHLMLLSSRRPIANCSLNQNEKRVFSIARVFAALVVAMLAGCASPYAANGLTGGFTETKIEPHIYKVGYSGNGNTSEEMVLNYWLYRCAELTLKSGYEFFGLLGSPKTSAIPDGYGNEDLLPTERRNKSFASAPYGQDQPMLKVGTAPTFIYIPSYGGTITRWRKEGTIIMFHERSGSTMNEQIYSLEAKTVVDMLRPYVNSAGTVKAPSRKDVVEAAMPSRPVPSQAN